MSLSSLASGYYNPLGSKVYLDYVQSLYSDSTVEPKQRQQASPYLSSWAQKQLSAETQSYFPAFPYLSRYFRRISHSDLQDFMGFDQMSQRQAFFSEEFSVLNRHLDVYKSSRKKSDREILAIDIGDVLLTGGLLGLSAGVSPEMALALTLSKVQNRYQDLKQVEKTKWHPIWTRIKACFQFLTGQQATWRKKSWLDAQALEAAKRAIVPYSQALRPFGTIPVEQLPVFPSLMKFYDDVVKGPLKKYMGFDQLDKRQQYLNEEFQELQDALREYNLTRGHGNLNEVAGELGDVLLTSSLLGLACGISPEAAMGLSIGKLEKYSDNVNQANKEWQTHRSRTRKEALSQAYNAAIIQATMPYKEATLLPPK